MAHPHNSCSTGQDSPMPGTEISMPSGNRALGSTRKLTGGQDSAPIYTWLKTACLCCMLMTHSTQTQHITYTTVQHPHHMCNTHKTYHTHATHMACTQQMQMTHATAHMYHKYTAQCNTYHIHIHRHATHITHTPPFTGLSP